MEQSRPFICPRCEQPSTGAVRGVAIWSGYDMVGDPVNPPVEYALLECGRCGDASVQMREDYGRGFDDDEPVIVFPASRRLSWIIPEPLRREWEEAQACLKAKAFAACLVMVRRTIEGTCQEQGVVTRSLGDGIKSLRDQGMIDSTLAEWAEALRIAGNQGAHYTGRTVAREDAEDALAFAEALLDHLYVLRRRFLEFQSRLADRKAQASSRT